MMGFDKRRLTDAALGAAMAVKDGERPTETPASCCASPLPGAEGLDDLGRGLIVGGGWKDEGGWYADGGAFVGAGRC